MASRRDRAILYGVPRKDGRRRLALHGRGQRHDRAVRALAPSVALPRMYLCFPLLVAIREFSGGLNASA